MNPNQLILKTCGIVYLRSTRLPNVIKIGRSNADGIKRASINGATIIRLCMSLNNHQMEKALIKGFCAKYEVYTGNEFYLIDSLLDAMQTFDQIFMENESKIYRSLSVTSSPPSATMLQQFFREEGTPELSEDFGDSRLRKRKRSV